MESIELQISQKRANMMLFKYNAATKSGKYGSILKVFLPPLRVGFKMGKGSIMWVVTCRSTMIVDFFFATDAKLRKKIMDVNKKFNPSRALRVCMDAYI